MSVSTNNAPDNATGSWLPSLHARARVALPMTYRVVGSVGGGYALWSGVGPLFGLGVHALGVPLTEAMLPFTMLGPPLYVGVLIYGFAAPLRWRPATTILLLGILSLVLAHLAVPTELYV